MNRYKSILDGWPCDCEDGNIRQVIDVNCLACEGTGELTDCDCSLNENCSHPSFECTYCDGTGKYSTVIFDVCPECGGSGLVDEPEREAGEEQMALI
jgi:hypothetical protein